MSKLDLAIIAAVLLGGAVLIEGGHRVVIDAPAQSDIAMHAPAACPDNDNVPYSAACIAFLEGRTFASRPPRANASPPSHVATSPPMR